MTMHLIPESYGSTVAAGYVEQYPGYFSLYDRHYHWLGYFSAFDACLVTLFGDGEPLLRPRFAPNSGPRANASGTDRKGRR